MKIPLPSSHFIAAAAIFAAIATPAFAATSKRDTDALAKATYIYIATVAKTATKAKRAGLVLRPRQAGPHRNLADQWKAKRIKRGSPAMIWIGCAQRPGVHRKAEIVTDTKLQDR